MAQQRPLSRQDSPQLDSDETLELLADEYAREVLKAITGTTRSATEIVEQCHASKVTVYRRLDRLKEAGIITETMELNPDGHHRRAYRNRLQELSVTISPDGIRIEDE